MSWKNVRLTDDTQNETVFGTLNFYMDGSICVTGPLTLADRAKISARTIAKHPGVAFSAVGFLVRTAAGIQSTCGNYTLVMRVKEATGTYRTEKENATELKYRIEDYLQLEPEEAEHGETVVLANGSRHYTIDFSGGHDAKSFIRFFRSEQKDSQ